MTHEVEIKLQVPPAALAAVRAELLRGACRRTRLKAQYFDTPSRSLAAAGWALRLRQEDRRWVQAVKGLGDGVLSRVEHEVARSVPRGVPWPEPALHAGMPGFDALERALGDQASALQPVVRTDVRRTHRIVRSAGAQVEIALDEGEIAAGDARVPVCELEFELKSGRPAALVALAARWAARHGLWLDVRTKAQRGWRLVNGEAWPPAAMQVPRLAAHMPADAALRACVRAALAQVMANGSVLAAGDGTPEHVHQARVGLRRLFSVVRAFGEWSPSFDPALLEPARALFAGLSALRDRDALAEALLPQLNAGGAPPLALPPAGGADALDPGVLFRSVPVNQGLFALLAWAHDDPGASEGVANLRALSAAQLARWHRRLRRAGRAFDTLEDAHRHEARKRAKRLRYAAEALAALWPAKSWSAYQRRLKAAQDALGRLQDARVAQALFEAQRESDPHAWFALGWLAARRPGLIERAARALRALGRVPRFLR